MALLKSKGASFFTLDESEYSVAQIVKELHLKRFPRKFDAYVRTELSFIIGQWHEETGQFLNPGHGLSSAEATKSLRKMLKHLRGLVAPLPTNEEFKLTHLIGRLPRASGVTHSHEIAVASIIAAALEANEEIASRGHALTFIEDYISRTLMLLEAVETSLDRMGKLKSRTGRPSLRWYRRLVALMVQIAKRNAIKPKIYIDGKTQQPAGQFFRLIWAFERLLPRHMRSPSPEACERRVRRVQKL